MVGGRRLSELLREQQEPCLLLPLVRGGDGATEAAPCCSSVANDKGAAGASWGRAVRRALPRWRWDGLAATGCFPCAARHKRESVRPLPRAGGHARCDDDAVGTESDGGHDGSARRLSPVSVLDVLRCSDSDEEEGSASSSPITLSDREDEKPSSTAGSSPPPDPLTDEKEEWRKVVSSWERIAALAELDVSASISMSRHEAERVGASVEAMIFEDMSAEAVRDMMELW
ncbi:hypothetical protein ZWY2020_051760 [Hordeum vulgare]|nr:hypothetical protein ZWY2020_051760 [Hordeum vulgare]